MQHRLRSQYGQRWMIVPLVLAGLLLAVIIALVVPNLGAWTSTGTSAEAVMTSEPARVEPLEGTDLSRVILSGKAAERLGIETGAVREEQIGGTEQLVIPYAAVLYDLDGTTWTYTNPESLVFVRHPITVDRIEGDLAILSDGPPVDTSVVTVGVAELYGIEFGVGH